MVKGIRTCSRCGFILGTRPGLKDRDGICLACLNSLKKNNINWKERQEWLTGYLASHRGEGKYDCAVGVSGGKDSISIVSRLMANHGVENPLLINIEDEFTKTKVGQYNIANIANHFGLDHIRFRFSPKDFRTHGLIDFEEKLHPLDWFEDQIYKQPLEIARAFGCRTLFMGENSAFEYGSSEECGIFDPLSDEETKVIYLGAIYPYSVGDSVQVARSCGFRDLDYYHEWYRQGQIDRITQIDSIGYIVAVWCKFPKFGFQRVSDMACRFVRDGLLTKEQAEKLIKDQDWVLDPAAKDDFCRTMGITASHFDEVVAKHANLDLVHQDCNGAWRRNDLD